MVFENLLNPVLNPLLKFPLIAVVLFLSFFITLLVTLIYKFTTNQDLMKQLKQETKELQKEMKELRNDPKKMMEVQKKAMGTNMKYMRQSLRSTLYTFIPIILLFGWMNAHLQFEPIRPGTEFSTTMSLQAGVKGNAEIEAPKGLEIIGPKNKTVEAVGGNENKGSKGAEVSWQLKGKEGPYLLGYKLNDLEYSKDVIITMGNEYAVPIKQVKDAQVAAITVNNQELLLLNLFGWKLGWLGTYILSSIIFSMALRKLFKVY
ncbi:DUF106 domain-containing protein [Candidatus Woesearchaeota archaeon]|nr:DUF106 domain-containing protein [Candidatus Woesearchaeota archaeon]